VSDAWETTLHPNNAADQGFFPYYLFKDHTGRYDGVSRVGTAVVPIPPARLQIGGENGLLSC
jgi:hypothetical protein